MVRGDLGVLWYGDPGPAEMINRHDAAAAPLSTDGRMFVQGHGQHHGLRRLQRPVSVGVQNPGAVRTGVFNNEDTSNFAASDDAVVRRGRRHCTAFDAATGKVLPHVRGAAVERRC